MNTVGVERRWIRASRLGARFGLRAPLVVFSTCLVFACSFAISRTLHAGTAARAEQPLSLPVASVTAAIPASLSDVAQIASTLRPPAPPPPRASARPSPGSGAASSVAPSLPEAWWNLTWQWGGLYMIVTLAVALGLRFLLKIN